MTFVDSAGAACKGCSLYSFHAGTTTPQPTYTDSTGTSQNTNPIILGADGGATIWMGNLSYKLILKDKTGATVWSVDNVNAGSLFPCASAGAIQIANNTSTGLTCDPNITINTTTHTISVGTLPANHVTIGALGTPTAWTLDTTSPATACASIGCGGVNAGTINQLAYYASAGTTLSGTSAIPAGITGTTQAPSDNSTLLATTAYVALPGSINPSSVQVASGVAMTGNQGNGTKIQHSTGTTTTNDCAKFDANGNTVDGGPCVLFAATNNVTGSRVLGASYQNTGTTPMFVSGYATISSGSGDSTVACLVGPSSPSITAFSMTISGTISGERAGFTCMVPAGSFYEVTGTNLISAIGSWSETQ